MTTLPVNHSDSLEIVSIRPDSVLSPVISTQPQEIGATLVPVNIQHSLHFGDLIHVQIRNHQTFLVIEVGGQSTIKQSFKCVARGGSIDVIGFLSGQENDQDAPSWIQPLLGACIVRGVEVGSREQVREMVKAVEAQNIKPVLDNVSFTLRELPEVYKRMWAGKHTGKAVISGIDKTGS